MKPMHVDIEKVIRSKYKGWLPKSLVLWLKKLIHQDEINEKLQLQDHIDGAAYAKTLLKSFNITFKIYGEKRLKGLEQQLLFVCNHPLGGLDGIALTAWLGDLYGSNIFVLVNDLLMNLPQFEDVFIAINKHGGQSRNLSNDLNKAIEDGKNGLTFPAGLCSRLYDDGKIKDPPWKTSFVRMAKKNNLTIVPLFFEGHNSQRFYKWARRRKKLKIKFNAEMILLPDEMFKGQGGTYSVYVGNPIPPEKIPEKRSDFDDFVTKLRQKIYILSSDSEIIHESRTL